jgi:hypothetical protein
MFHVEQTGKVKIVSKEELQTNLPEPKSTGLINLK